jgi:hypothetical protein
MMMRNFKTIIYISIFLLVFNVVFSADIYQERLDLADYPYFLVHNDRFNFNFVIGEFAQSADALATAEIAKSLVQNFEEISNKTKQENFELDVLKDSDIKKELTELYIDVLSKKKNNAAMTYLDTSFNSSNIKDKNLILVGGPCVNSATAYFYDYPEDCAEGFVDGRAKIELIRNGKGVVMIVAGYSAEDTQTAAHILSNYKDYSSNFAGDKLRVSSAWTTELRIN